MNALCMQSIFTALLYTITIFCSAGADRPEAIQLEGDACFELATAIPRLRNLTGNFNLECI